jgi:hemerythrin
MAYFQWSQQLSLGNRFLDADHQRIIALINELHDAMQKRAGEAIVGKVLFDLIVYCKGHFMREEEHMIKIAFAGYNAHKQEHEALLAKVNTLHRAFKEGNGASLTIQTAHFLRDWLSSHILKSDMELAVALAKVA